MQSVTLSTQKVLPMSPSWPTLQNTPPPTTGPSATHSTVILVSAIKRRTNKIHPTVARLSSRRHSTHKRGPMHSWSNLVCLTLMLYVAFGIIPTYPSRRTTSRGSTRWSRPHVRGGGSTRKLSYSRHSLASRGLVRILFSRIMQNRLRSGWKMMVCFE